MSKTYWQTKTVLVTLRITVLEDATETDIQNIVYDALDQAAGLNHEFIKVEDDDRDLHV